PMNALRYTIDFDISRFRFGHASFQCVYTFHPPPSMTNVTITLGGVFGYVSPGSSEKCRGWKSCEWRKRAVVGARSASVTSSSRVSGLVTIPGAKTVIGTRSRYGHVIAWLLRGSRWVSA